MNTERVFLIALLISFTVHGVIFLKNSGINLFPLDLNEKKIEVSYLKDIEENPKPKLEPKDASLHRQRQEFLKLPAKITVDERMPPQYQIQKNEPFLKPVFPKPDVIALKKKISLPPVDMNKINNPSYISYYQIVREKIRRAAYQNYSRTEVGEIYLSFIIASDGSMKEVHFIAEKSTGSQFLTEVALKSIDEASPFPAFPKELNYPQLSFNVIISFEVE